MDAIVNGIDPRGGARGLLLRAEGQREHGRERPVQAPQPPPAIGRPRAGLAPPSRPPRSPRSRWILQAMPPATKGSAEVDPLMRALCAWPGNFGSPPPVVWALPLTLERRAPCVE